jgi:glycosyltransferase involved in cell wall biosynthesis
MTRAGEGHRIVARLEALTAIATTAQGSALILSANPMHDTGGGQRSAQLALELLARDFAVAFVSHGRVTETRSLGLDFNQPRLVELSLSDLRHAGVQAALEPLFEVHPALVLTQVPVRDWLPIVEMANRRGAATIYDCIDRWDSELGRGWYQRSAEQAMVEACAEHTASAPDLVEHVERLSGLVTHLLPNAYNARVFDSAESRDRPGDLPESGRVALYVGALWYRMDWSMVRRAAERNPDTCFVFIGDHRREGRGLPDNCAFLGLKAQGELPPYLAHADVAFLPWRVDPVTQSTSPLKVYEFVAMGLPVVAPDLEPLRSVPGVAACTSEADFLDRIGRVDRASVTADISTSMGRFASENSWTQRVDEILRLAAHGRSAAGTRDPSRGIKRGTRISVVIPSYNHERYLGAAIDSVRSQLLSASELVVVDDGSTDRSREVLADRAFPSMRVIEQENRGAHRAINRAIALSGGDYVAILNSDDLFEPERLEQAWGVARSTGAALVLGAVRLIDEEGGAPDPNHEIVRWYRDARAMARTSLSLKAILRRENIAVTTSNFFMHRELWRRLGGFRAFRYVHDFDFLLRAVELCPDRVRYVDSLEGVLYRVHGRNTITESNERAVTERREMMSGFTAPVARVRRWVRRHGARRALLGAIGRSDSLAIPTPGGGTARSEPRGSLRVGIVLRSLGRGGLEEVVALLAQSLPAHGGATTVLCTHEGGSVADRLRRAGVSLTVGEGQSERWRAWMEDEEVQVVSSHSTPLEALSELARSGVPIVETIHNTYAWFTAEDWESERVKTNLFAASIAVSDAASTYYAKRSGVLPDYVIPNAVHPGRAARVPRTFARGELGIPLDLPLFVSVGRLTEQKNPAGLLAAFSAVVAQIPDARLLLVGPADGSVSLSKLKSRHRRLFSTGSVRHVGVVDDVGILLSAADAFVSNAFYEGWSMAASEAAWVGLPLILSDAGANRSLVGPKGERGILVPNPLGDPLAVDKTTLAQPPVQAVEVNRQALADAMIAVASRPHDWLARAEETRGYARANLTPAVICAAYMDAFREISSTTTRS